MAAGDERCFNEMGRAGMMRITGRTMIVLLLGCVPVYDYVLPAQQL